MNTDLIMTNHSNREWQDDETFDLPFPTEAMKIIVCRSRGSLKGIQIYMDVGTDNTGYSGLLGRYILQLKWNNILNVFVANKLKQKEDKQNTEKQGVNPGARELYIMFMKGLFSSFLALVHIVLCHFMIPLIG